MGATKMSIREAIAWASSDVSWIDGADDETLTNFLATCCDALMEKLERQGESLLTDKQPPEAAND